jgi:carbohydrate-binding DOMON domain-containing protein
MRLFALCLDTLSHAHENSLTGIRFGNNKSKPAVIAYADDVMLLQTSPSEIPRIRTITDQYGAASGAKINISKSKALAVGAWDTSVDIMGITYHREMKILGTHLTN